MPHPSRIGKDWCRRATAHSTGRAVGLDQRRRAAAGRCDGGAAGRFLSCVVQAALGPQPIATLMMPNNIERNTSE